MQYRAIPAQRADIASPVRTAPATSALRPPDATTAYHIILVLKKLDPSSTANRIPPIGAPKAAATPAAAPAATNSLRGPGSGSRIQQG